MDYSSIERYCQANGERFVEELSRLCSIPSVSTDPAHAADVRKSAAFVADELRRLNFDRVEIWETEGHPAVFASKQTSSDAPTVLVYGHHDVQPADPLDQWKTPPFEPTVRDGCLYARGAADDKGQVWMHMKAIETCVSDGSSLPVNLKVIIEGEEEVGSTHFGDLLKAHHEDLRCDVACVSDSAFFEKGVPSLDTGLRGLVVLEAVVTSANQDCHSGEFGGAVFNPIRVLAGIITSLHDANNRVNVPGFYDDVAEATSEERAQVASLPFDMRKFLSNAGGAMAEVGEAGWSSLERTWMRPTLEYNGITGGFQGEGSKTIIPARASVKITCRLVPNQDPADIAKKVSDALKSRVPEGVAIEVSGHAHAYPVLTPMDHPAVVAAQDAIEKSFGKRTVVARMGGTIPPVAMFQKELGVPTILAGFGLPDDRLHGPNEKFDLEQFFGGIRAMAYLWTQLPAVMPAKVS